MAITKTKPRPPKAPKAYTRLATEAMEQECLMRWANLQENTYPELGLLFAVPNGGSRHKLEAYNLKKQGVRAGVPDLVLPVARREHHGMYIEMKRLEGGRLSEDQVLWLDKLKDQGYYAVVCKGWESAVEQILWYLGITKAFKI